MFQNALMIQLHPLSQLKNYVTIHLLLVKNQVKIYIGTIITPTKSISDICHTVGNLLNAEKISLLLQHVPPPAVLPTTFSRGCNRKFNVSWLTKYPWLRYSPKLDAVLCGPFTLLLQEDSRKDKGWLVNWVKLSEVLQNHSKLTYHRDAVQSADVLKISIENPASRIDVQMSSSLQSQMAENKHILCQIVRAVLFLAKQGMAFRGDREDIHS